MARELLSNITMNIKHLDDINCSESVQNNITALKRARIHLLLRYLHDENMDNDLKLELFNEFGEDIDEIPEVILDIMNGGEEDDNE